MKCYKAEKEEDLITREIVNSKVNNKNNEIHVNFMQKALSMVLKREDTPPSGIGEEGSATLWDGFTRNGRKI